MNICIAGWHYGPGLDMLKEYGGFVVSHKPHEKADVVIPNVGLEFGCYDWFLQNQWKEGSVLFTHDDNEFTEEALAAISEIDADQAFIFSEKIEEIFNGGIHGRVFFCSDRFLRHLKEDGGFWYDEGNRGDIRHTTELIDYHNNSVKIFHEYLQGINSGMVVHQSVFIPGMKLGYRGDKDLTEMSIAIMEAQ